MSMSVALAGALGGVAEPDTLSEILPDRRIGSAAMTGNTTDRWVYARRHRLGCNGGQAETAHQVVGQGKPESDCLGFVQATDEEALQTAVAGQGIDALGRRGTVLVNCLRVGRGHPGAPGDDARRVAEPRRMRIAVRIPRLGYRGIDRRLAGG